MRYFVKIRDLYRELPAKDLYKVAQASSDQHVSIFGPRYRPGQRISYEGLPAEIRSLILSFAFGSKTLEEVWLYPDQWTGYSPVEQLCIQFPPLFESLCVSKQFLNEALPHFAASMPLLLCVDSVPFIDHQPDNNAQLFSTVLKTLVKHVTTVTSSVFNFSEEGFRLTDRCDIAGAPRVLEVFRGLRNVKLRGNMSFNLYSADHIDDSQPEKSNLSPVEFAALRRRETFATSPIFAALRQRLSREIDYCQFRALVSQPELPFRLEVQLMIYDATRGDFAVVSHEIWTIRGRI